MDCPSNICQDSLQTVKLKKKKFLTIIDFEEDYDTLYGQKIKMSQGICQTVGTVNHVRLFIKAYLFR